MKIYFLILCVGALLCSTHGGLLKDVVGTIHEKAHNIREDIRSVLHHKDDHHSKNTIPDTDVKLSTTEKNSEVVKSHHSDKTEFVTTEKSSEAINIESPSTGIAFPTEKTEVKPTESYTVPSTTVASNTTKDDKDGRENFAGGCATGFKKTADGRCKPTF
ncbi:growth-blocking peptide, long form-like [Pieris napi]|uniref:growth-blocking peptide, long form-like n=1 Tax=Pieris napi TaxID=78633 RepID=UPI001FBBEA7A|nr:growth-blocking peptide, long form-like [Pieris napi]